LGGLVGGGASVAAALGAASCAKKVKKKAAPAPVVSNEPDLTIPTEVDGHAIIPIIPGQPVANATLMAVFTVLLPTNGGLPGAIETNVPRTVAGVLSEPRFKGVQKLLQRGAEGLNKIALDRHNGLYARSSLNVRRQILTDIQSDPSGDVPWSAFVNALLDFTMEAYLGHPARGANPDGVVWEALNVSIEGKPFRRPQNRQEPG